jgi:hypothetical protein
MLRWAAVFNSGCYFNGQTRPWRGAPMTIEMWIVAGIGLALLSVIAGCALLIVVRSFETPAPGVAKKLNTFNDPRWAPTD